MQKNPNYQKMYLKSVEGIDKAIAIIHSNLTNEDKLAQILEQLIGTSQECEDLF